MTMEIDHPVDPRLEMTEICDRVLRAGGPALLFERPVSDGQPCAMPVLANLFGTPERVAMGMGASLKAVNSARRVTGGSQYLASVMQNLAAQPYANLLAMNGNQLFDQATLADSNFTVDIVAFETEIDLLQLEATLNDRRTGRELGTITTLRTKR